MVETPRIPTRIFFHGDTAAAKKLVGFGRKRYSDLIAFMNPQKLKTHFNQLRLNDGSIITTHHNHGLSEIHIYVPPMPGSKLIETERQCKCGKYFAEGEVVAVNHVDGYIKATQLYTVSVCQKGGKQIDIENCVSNDFHEYKVGEKVWCCLSIKEVAVTAPYCFVRASTLYLYAYKAAWGCIGTEQGFSIVDKDMDNDPYYLCYDGSYVTLSPNAGGPCSNDLDVPSCDEVEDGETCWQGVYPHMCELTEDLTDCYWFFESPEVFQIQKDHTSLYCEYLMKQLLGETGMEIPEITHLFNLQIVGRPEE